MSSSCICVDPSDLETSAKNYEQAAQQFAMAKAQFVSAGTPNFGLILKCLEPAYEAAKQSTQEYLANVETMLKLIASAIQGTVEDSTTTEEEILEALKKILQLLQQVDDKLDSSDPHNARSEGNGGIGGNSGYGGSFGNGGGSKLIPCKASNISQWISLMVDPTVVPKRQEVRHHLRQVLVQWRRDRKNSAMIRKKQHLMVRVMRRNRTLIRFSMRFHFQQDQPRLDWMWMETPKTTTL